MPCSECDLLDISRRNFLRVGALNLAGIGLSQFLQLQSRVLAAEGSQALKSAKAQSCILLWLEGGPSQVDTWDPKPGESTFKPISTNVPGIQISELLPRVAKNMDKLSVIRSMHTEETNHTQAIHYAITGHRPNPAMRFPSIGSIISKEMGSRNNIPSQITEPQFDGDDPFRFEVFKGAFLGAEYDSMILPDPSEKDFQVPDLSLPKTITAERIADRRAFLSVVDAAYRKKVEYAEHASLDKFTEQALKMVLSPTVKNAFDLSQESEKTKDAYGRNRFGQSVLLARRLIEGGSRFVTAAGYGFQAWDTHNDNDKTLSHKLTPVLDQTLSTLLEDLKQRGLLESTVVIVMGEFGRTVRNPKNGRDHWPQCWSVAVGGGGIAGGKVIGSSDAQGQYVKDDMVTMGDLFATVYKAFGIDWEKAYMSPIGRPVKIANSIDDLTGTPVKGLV
jgi:Protein of unknown function (DUF1501)